MKPSKLVMYTLAVALVVVVGILTWRFTAPRPESAASQQPATAAGAAAAGTASQPSSANAPSNSAADQNSQVIINGLPLPTDQLEALQARYRTRVPPGRYWYDTRSGFWGLEGYAVAGFMQPGVNFGTLSPRASNGDTGVFVNGRELNQAEAMFFARIFGSYQQGHFWLDGNTGFVGYEGDPTPRDNLFARIRQSQGGSQALSTGGMVGVTNGGCTMVTTDTGYNASTPGCD